MSKFTPNQEKAIAARGNVLVMAGAGTGKTRTLVHRCLQWLREAPGEHSLEQVLMVTFTDAAAAEMRHRIREELKKELERAPESPHWAEQLALLEVASISTLHSFCYRLVREHFYELELDPNLVVCPEEEARLLAEETLTAILEKHYAGDGAQARAVQRLIHVQARGWDVPVRRLILRLHHYSQTLPDPNRWFDQQLALFSDPTPGQWRSWLQDALVEWRRAWLEVLPAWAATAPNMADCQAALDALPMNPGLGDMHEALAAISAACARPWPRGTAGKVRDRLKDFFAEAEFLRHLTGRCTLPQPEPGERDDAELVEESARAGDDPLAQDWVWVRREMRTLVELAREFQRAFSDAKRELGVVDFHDLEQSSLRLLWDAARQSPSVLAQAWRSKLRLIFVDEYQDINAAQDAILRALASEGDASNRFLVGDPKQSIYRFRLAAPHIFQEYALRWESGTPGAQVIPLTENFRSHPGILDAVNSIFSSLMRREIGGVQYDEKARLQPGLKASGAQAEVPDRADPAEAPVVELHLRRTSAAEEGDAGGNDETEGDDDFLASLTNAEYEARLTGLRLAQLRSECMPIMDRATGAQRPVAWRDVVILLRSPRSKVEGYAKEFARLGIPLNAARGGFFESPAVADLLNLLTVLDNPLQDMPLVGVLRSPLAGLSVDDLALVRLTCKGRYWTALQLFHRALRDANGDPARADPQRLGPRLADALAKPGLQALAQALWPRLELFVKRYGEWRRLARQASLSECLRQALAETHYTAYFLSQPRGQQQGGNISKLLTWARQHDQFQRQGLYRFLKFLEAQREAEIDHEPAPLEIEDAVRLMSIHQSKGLEFGVVVVADLGKAFNLSDLRSDLILDERYGLCPSVKPPYTGQRYPSLPHWLAQRHQRRETLGEEMRLLYVAMTRACQRLVLVGTTSVSAVARWAARTEPADTRGLLSASSYLDWLGPWFQTATGRPDWAEQERGRSPGLDWFVYADQDARLSAAALASVPGDEQSVAAAPDPDRIEALKQKLSWRYPAISATQQAAKASVSALRKAIVAQADDEPARARAWAARGRAGKGRLDAAAVGSAHHLFLQFLALERAGDLDGLQTEAERMVAEGLLLSDERRALDLEALADFWRSSIGRELRAQASHLHRELPFTFRMTVEEMRHLGALQGGASSSAGSPAPGTSPDDEFMVVTGVVDAAVLRPEEIWILDFKTDAVAPGEWPEHARMYEPQMRLYALALSRIYGRPVTRCWLHSVPLRRTIECPVPQGP